MKKIFLFVGLVIFGCSSDDQVNIALVEHEKILSYSAHEAEMAFSAIGLDDIHPDLEYDFAVYEISYTTKYGDRNIEASALVAVPDTEVALPIISFQHGTIIAHSEAPSSNLFYQLPIFSLASTGYIVVIPDFIGFGKSSNIFHPYYVAEPMGRSVYDAVVATKELLSGVEGSFDGNVFLAGYSEGGYATMAAHKYLEEHPRGDLTLIASAPASGGYDVKLMQEHFFNLDTYNQPFYMAYVALAYKNFYTTDEPMSTYFQEPYASELEPLFNGDYTGSQINAQLTNVVADFLQPDMLENFETSEKYRPFREMLEENSLVNWSPAAPMYMYHGTEDVTVPYSNSELSFEKLVQNEADAERIKLFPLEGKDHGSGVIPYVTDVYYRFKDLK